EEGVDADGAEGEDEQEADRDVRDPAGDVVVAHVPDAPERDDTERGERGEARDGRSCDVEEVDRVRREEALLAEELDEVGDRLEEAEGGSPVWAVAELHAPDELPPRDSGGAACARGASARARWSRRTRP